MKTTLLTTALASALATTIAAAPAALADHKGRKFNRDGFNDYAQVIEVEPLTRTVVVSTPRRECWEEETRRPVVHVVGGDSAGGMIIGGIVGGVIGHRIGRGHSGRDAATLAGTLIGATIGHDVAHKSARVTESEQVDYVQRCRVAHERHTEERVDGYEVTYRYGGETFTTRLPYDPGKRLRVRVSVAPVRD